MVSRVNGQRLGAGIPRKQGCPSAIGQLNRQEQKTDLFYLIGPLWGEEQRGPVTAHVFLLGLDAKFRFK